MDPSSPQTQSATSQPTAIQPANSTNVQVSSSRYYKKIFVNLGILLMILALGGISFFLFQVNQKTNQNNTNVNLPVLPITTSSTNAIPSNQALTDYDSQCMSFKYPSDWKKWPQNKEVNMNGNILQNITLLFSTEETTDTPDVGKLSTFTIFIQCSGKSTDFTLDPLIEQQNLTKSFSGRSATASAITIDGVSGNKGEVDALASGTAKNMTGRVEVLSLRNNTRFAAYIQWIGQSKNDLNDPVRKEFETMLSSVHIKDYFK